MTHFAEVAALVDNPVAYADDRRFAAILGANPSKGARSPLLWNAAFAAHEVDAAMLPLDVPGDRLGGLLSALDGNPCFMGGAVAVPHKEAVAECLGGRVTPEAAAIGAVNCLFRDDAGRLMGTNTDGEGALASFQRHIGSVAGRSVLVMGPGGAGKAVAAFFRRAVEPGGRLTIAGRSAAGKVYAERLQADWVDWHDLAAVLPGIDSVINCTPVGSRGSVGESPLSAELLRKAPRDAIVFDIIYDPSPSALLRLACDLGLQGLDGAEMNVEQAVLAFAYASRGVTADDVTRRAMAGVSRQLRIAQGQ